MAIPKKVKRSTALVEQATAPVGQAAPLFDGGKWPGYVLLAYTIAWFFFVSSFIGG